MYIDFFFQAVRTNLVGKKPKHNKITDARGKKNESSLVRLPWNKRRLGPLACKVFVILYIRSIGINHPSRKETAGEAAAIHYTYFCLCHP